VAINDLQTSVTGGWLPRSREIDARVSKLTKRLEALPLPADEVALLAQGPGSFTGTT
jgi:hypothetical protein